MRFIFVDLTPGEVFGRFPRQTINVFGEWERIIAASHEIILHFGGLLHVRSFERNKMDALPGVKIPIRRKNYKYPLHHEVDYWLVEHIFIRNYFRDFLDKYDFLFDLNHCLS